MVHPDLIVFDCDGTLIDTEPFALASFRLVLAASDVRYSQSELEDRFAGITLSGCEETVQADHGIRLPRSWRTHWLATFREQCARGVPAVTGVREAVADLAAAGNELCVASNAAHADIHRNLAAAALLPAFAGRLFSAEAVTAGKPAPDVFLHAARVLGADPARCVVIEDSVPGVLGAVAAGMHVLGYAPTISRAAALETAGATAVFPSMTDLPDLVAAASTPRKGRRASGPGRDGLDG